MEFTVSTMLKASPKTIYDIWLDSEGHSKMTGGFAEITDQEGNSFSAWDGYISGKNLELEPGKRIVQSWRTTEFKEDEPDSQIEVLLEEKNDQTELTLIHTNVPEDGEPYIQGWHDHYFEPMKEYFSE